MKQICIGVFLIISFQLFSQNETNHWYFGKNAGLDFSQGGFTVKNDGAMDTPAGTASISDGNGDLLMYTNGASIWNKNHELMTNGTGLAGEVSLTQTSIIVPNPQDNSLYYVITSRANASTNPVFGAGIYYSEVRFSSANPLGEVVLKNQRLTQSSSGKLTGVHHADGVSVWIIGLGGSAFEEDSPKNTYFVFKVEGTGINLERLINVGDVGSRDEVGSKGAMKMSPDGKVLGVADYDNSWLYTYNFNTATGEITPKKEYNANISLGSVMNPYGLEFSPDSQLMYYTAIQNGVTFFVFQTDLNGNEFTFSHTAFIQNGLFPGAMQLANNGKIYVSYTPGAEDDSALPELGVIENPNVVGNAVLFRTRGVRLLAAAAKKGLPNFIQSYFQTRILTEDQCALVPFNFRLETYTSILDITWDFGDGTVLNAINPSHAYTAPGTFTVRADARIASGVNTVYKEVTVFELPQLTPNQFLEQCDSDTDGLSTFNLFNSRTKITFATEPEALEFYLTLADAQNNSNAISNPQSFTNTQPNQEIFVKATNSNDCSAITSFNLIASFVDLGDISPVFSCENADGVVADGNGLFDLAQKRSSIYNELNIQPTTSLRFFETLADAQAIINELDDLYTSPTKTIWMRAEDGNLGCSGIEAVPLVVNQTPFIALEDSYTICIEPSLHPPVVVRLDNSNDRFEWYNEANQLMSSQQEFTLTTPGMYTAVVYKTENGIECSNSKTFTVRYPDAPTIQLLEADTSTAINTISVHINGSSSYEYSLDNSTFFGEGTRHVFTGVSPGIQTVYVRDKNNCQPPIQQDISVIGYPAFFSPNNDGTNDYWKITGVNSTFFQSMTLHIVDRYGKLIAEYTDLDGLGWDGTYGGKALPPNSYWFKVELIDLNDTVITKIGNFSLVRNQ